MLQFFTGLAVGVIIGFITCAVLSINNFEKDNMQDIPNIEEKGESNAGK